VNVPHIVVGFRDDSGLVQSIGHYNTHDLARNEHWDGNICLFFTNEILELVVNSITEDNLLYTMQSRWPTVKLYKVNNPSTDRTNFAKWFTSPPTAQTTRPEPPAAAAKE